MIRDLSSTFHAIYTTSRLSFCLMPRLTQCLTSHHSFYLMSYLSYYLKSDLPYYLTQNLSYLISFYVSFLLLFCLITHTTWRQRPPLPYHLTDHKYCIVVSCYKFFITKETLQLKKNINNLISFKFNILTRMHMAELHLVRVYQTNNTKYNPL
jgi:hypothetical protein